MEVEFDNDSKIIFNEEKLSIQLWSNRSNAKDYETKFSKLLEPLFPEHKGLKTVTQKQFDMWMKKVKKLVNGSNILELKS